jgi:hypothetical protein
MMLVYVLQNVEDGFAEGVTVAEAGRAACQLAAAGATAFVCSGGFVSRNGFFMLRGKTPLLSLARAMPGWLKRLAVLLFGPVFVPTVPFGSLCLYLGLFCLFRTTKRTCRGELFPDPSAGRNGGAACRRTRHAGGFGGRGHQPARHAGCP